MKIITPEFEELFKNYPLYSQDWVKDPIVVAKLFVWNITWYLTEYDKKSKDAFWYTTWLGEDEFWYIHIPELENVKVNGIWEVERDLYLTQAPLTTFLTQEQKDKVRKILWK